MTGNRLPKELYSIVWFNKKGTEKRAFAWSPWPSLPAVFSVLLLSADSWRQHPFGLGGQLRGWRKEGKQRQCYFSHLGEGRDQRHLQQTQCKREASFICRRNPHQFFSSPIGSEQKRSLGSEQDKQPAVDCSRRRTSEGRSDLHNFGQIRHSSKDDRSRRRRLRLRLPQARHITDTPRYD